MLTSEVCTVRFEGDGVATEFAIPFKYALNQDLTAQIQVLSYDGTDIIQLVEGTDYHMAGDGYTATGKVVFENPPAAGIKLGVLRNVPLLQLTDWVNGEEIDLEDMELEFDRIVMALQQLQERAERSTITSIFSENTPNHIVEETKEYAEGAQSAANDAISAAQQASDAADTATAAAEHAVEVVDGKQDIIEDLDDIRAGAAKGATAAQPDDIGNATLTIQKNSTDVGTFTANAKTDQVINLPIPTTAADVSALPVSTKYGASLVLSINSSTYVVTLQLKDQDGNNLGGAQTIDLPLESVVVSGSYDSTNKKIILTLQNGNTLDIPVGDLIAGLQTEINSSNPLSADLVSDSNTTNKFVSASEKSTWNAKQDAISDLSTIRSGAAAGATAVQPGDLADVATSGAYSDLTGQPTKLSDFNNDSGFITGISSSMVITALGYTPYSAANPDGYITGISSSMVTTALGYTPYSAANPDGYITGITSSMVTTALGYTPYNASNPNGYITGISSSDVTTALGYTPYNSSNPSGYITGISSSMVTTALGYTPADTNDIPTVNNATITFTQGGVTKGTITLNQSGDATIALDSGGSGTISYNAATETLTWS